MPVTRKLAQQNMSVEPLKLRPLESEMSVDKKVFKYVKMAVGIGYKTLSQAQTIIENHKKIRYLF